MRKSAPPPVKFVSLLLVLLAMVVVAGCRKGAGAGATSSAPGATAQTQPPKPMPAQLPDVIARVNGESVTKSNFELLVRNMELSQGPIPAERRDEILRGALDRLVTYTLLQQEAKARNIAASDAEVEERLKAMRSQFPNEEEFTKALSARSMSVERLRDDARADLVIGKMMEAEVAAVAAASDAEVRNFYDKNPDKFKRDEAVRASHILIKVDANADEATKKKARTQIDGVLKRARAGEDFAKLAQAHSQDGSAAQGGDLNFFSRGQMVPAFEQAAFALKTGEISDVVTSQFGYHIIKVTGRREPSTVPLDQVSERVKDFLNNQKKQQRADAFIASLKQKSKIEVLV